MRRHDFLDKIYTVENHDRVYFGPIHSRLKKKRFNLFVVSSSMLYFHKYFHLYVIFVMCNLLPGFCVDFFLLVICKNYMTVCDQVNCSVLFRLDWLLLSVLALSKGDLLFFEGSSERNVAQVFLGSPLFISKIDL